MEDISSNVIAWALNYKLVTQFMSVPEFAILFRKETENNKTI